MCLMGYDFKTVSIVRDPSLPRMPIEILSPLSWRPMAEITDSVLVTERLDTVSPRARQQTREWMKRFPCTGDLFGVYSNGR
jgi:hypothetical protein